MTLLDAVSLLILMYFFAVNGAYFLLNFVSLGALRRHIRRLQTVQEDDQLRDACPPVTIIVPAYNEEANCVAAVQSFLTLDYPQLELVVVNDGSRDGTLARLQDHFRLERSWHYPTAQLPTQGIRGAWRSPIAPELLVIDKENGGKADALNAGLNHTRTPLFCAVDSDTLLERDALLRVCRPFLEDEQTVASSGIIRIVNGCEVRDGQVRSVRLSRKLLPRFQVVEYLRSFLAGRIGWSSINAMMIISGAFGIFRRADVVEVGGFSTSTVGEDMELVLRLHRLHREAKRRYRIRFVPDPVAWTECPESLNTLARQRDRWQRGLLESMVRHRRLLFNPRYGALGMLAYPFFLFFELIGPVIELSGYLFFTIGLYAGWVNSFYAIAFFTLAVVMGVALSFAAVGLEEIGARRYKRLRDLLGLYWCALLENFGYRQLTSVWRVQGMLRKAFGARGWGKQTRKGFQS